MKTRTPKRVYTRYLLAPLFGVAIFFFLYILAAVLYPGGALAGDSSEGFSMMENYWCDLMATTTKNGLVNHIRFIAVIAWCILCFSLCLFWIYLPRLFTIWRARQRTIQFSGVIASVAAVFSFTRFHDIIINLAGFFGTIALILAFMELKRERHYYLLGLGIFCFFLGLLNYLFYTTRFLTEILPLLQKVTYAFCLFGFGLGAYDIYRRENKRHNGW